MSRQLRYAALGLAVLPTLFAISAAPASAAVTLEVMNPSGDIPPPQFHAPSARVSNLDGKKVGLYWIGKAGGDNFWDGIEAVMRQRHPNIQIVRYQGPFDLGDAQAAKVAKEVDTMFYGVGD
jgi:hypothetical protein